MSTKKKIPNLLQPLNKTHGVCFFQDPKVYVQTTLDVHKKYNALVMSAFNNDAGFVAALDKVGNL